MYCFIVIQQPLGVVTLPDIRTTEVIQHRLRRRCDVQSIRLCPHMATSRPLRVVVMMRPTGLLLADWLPLIGDVELGNFYFEAEGGRLSPLHCISFLKLYWLSDKCEHCKNTSVNFGRECRLGICSGLVGTVFGSILSILSGLDR